MRAPEEEAPISGFTKVDGQSFEGLVVKVVGSSGEFGEGSDGISDVKATKDISKENFTKKGAVTEAKFVGQSSMLGGAFRGTGRGVKHLRNIALHKGGAGFGRCFVGARCLPVVGLEKATDVGFSGKFNVGGCLEDIVAIVVSEKAEIFKRDHSFIGALKLGTNVVIDLLGKLLGFAGNGKVIDLANHEDVLAVNGSSVDILLMGSVGEAKFRKDAVDVVFPEDTRFRVTLECTENRDDQGAVEFDTSALFIPFGKGIINFEESGFGRARGMGVGVFGITTKDGKVLGSC